jgi:hypothetical protein
LRGRRIFKVGRVAVLKDPPGGEDEIQRRWSGCSQHAPRRRRRRRRRRFNVGRVLVLNDPPQRRRRRIFNDGGVVVLDKPRGGGR